MHDGMIPGAAGGKDVVDGQDCTIQKRGREYLLFGRRGTECCSGGSAEELVGVGGNYIG